MIRGFLQRQFYNGFTSLICAVSISSCQQEAQQLPASSSDYPTRIGSYLVARAQVLDIVDKVPAIGEVHRANEVIVGAEVSGRVSSIHLNVGDSVEPGQLLVSIEREPFEATLRREQAALEVARADLRVAEIRERDANNQLERGEQLAGSGYLPQAEFRSLQFAAQEAEALRERSAAVVAQVQARVDDAMLRLELTHIRAPIAGVISSQTITEGQTINSSVETPELLTIESQTSTDYVLSYVSERDIRRINIGMRVHLEFAGIPGSQVVGSVISIGNRPNRRGQFVSYPVHVGLQNPPPGLLPSMTAILEFVRSDAESVLAVPIEALYFLPEDYEPHLSDEEMQLLIERVGEPDEDPLRRWALLMGFEEGRLIRDGNRRIFLFEGGVYRAIEVAVGVENDEFVQILSTNLVEAGDLIIVDEINP